MTAPSIIAIIKGQLTRIKLRNFKVAGFFKFIEVLRMVFRLPVNVRTDGVLSPVPVAANVN